MWVARTVKQRPQQIILYAYSKTRSGTFAQKLYQNFTGILQCDGYAGYNLLANRVTRVGCWAHVRRKFYDAAQVNGKTVASVPLTLIDEMFAHERQWQHFPRAYGGVDDVVRFASYLSVSGNGSLRRRYYLNHV